MEGKEREMDASV